MIYPRLVASIALLGLAGSALVAERGYAQATASAGAVPASAPPPRCAHLPPPNAPPAVPNDNRQSAGTLRDGVLTLHLVARGAAWYPDGAGGCSLRMHAFAEEGRPAQIPGPLLRVRAGTEVRVTLRNALDRSIWVRGLEDRGTGTLAQVEIAAGATHQFRFRATTPGTYFYWASELKLPPPLLWPPSNADGTLLGGFVVDPAHGQADDRIFILTRWTAPDSSPAAGFELNTINGLSWPHTERLTVVAGEPVRWRVINASNDEHFMHLHGFYFRVLSLGRPVGDDIYPPAARPLAVTQFLGPGRTMELEWTPDRVGNWIFHCHLVRHMSAAQRLDRMPGAAGATAATASPHDADATHEMAGLILGVTVRPGRSTVRSPSRAPLQRVRIFADMRARVFGDRPGYGFIVQQGDDPPARDSIRIPGTPILLTRGRPVQITVFNRIPRPITVHWHGIEVDSSYVDGVAGWSGAHGRTAPAIAPGDSFVVRFTPPRAGTFIYHVHTEQRAELASGLYAPLIVLEPGQTFDSATDRIFVISEPGPGDRPGAERAPFVNGTSSPAPLELVAGTTYRFRFIGISASDEYIVQLERANEMQMWRPVARDGAEYPAMDSRSDSLAAARRRAARPDRAAEPPWPMAQPARTVMGPGTTFDVEITPRTAGDLALVFNVVNALNGRPAAASTVDLHVR